MTKQQPLKQTILLRKDQKNIKAIINGCKSGEAKSQRMLYDLYVDKMYNVVYRITVHQQNTEDALQEAFSSIFRCIDQWDSKKGTIYSWMSRICINAALAQYRKKKLHLSELNDAIYITSERSNILEDLSASYIFKAIKLLPHQYRTVFTLYEVEGYKHIEIASLLEISEHSSRTYLHRAKQKLKHLLNKDGQQKKIRITSL